VKLLVVGGNGHYAGLITAHLADKHDITVFDRNAAPCGFRCKQIVGDILDGDQIAAAGEGVDAVVTFFLGDATVSTMGMVNVMMAAEQQGIEHVVYTSSGGMPFPSPAYSSGDPRFSIRTYSQEFWRSYFPMTEEADMFPGQETSAYFLHKWLCEQIGQRVAARGKVKLTAIRPGLLMHDDMSNRNKEETERNYRPFLMLMTGQVRMCDCARMYDLALCNPPAEFEAYHCSNDTPYNNLSVEKAKQQLGYACIDQKPYMDFYTKMDWKTAFNELSQQGFPEEVLRSMYAFRSL